MPSSHLELYLTTCLSLLTRYSVPGVLFGKGGILWSRDGTEMTATAVPKHLAAQVLALYDSSLLASLLSRILVPLSTELTALGSEADLKDVKDSLSQTSHNVAQEAVKADPSGGWFTSKWASRLMNSVSASWQSLLTTTGRGTEAARGESRGQQLVKDTSVDVTGTAPAPVDMSLVGALCSLWSLLLSHASIASMESVPWTALSSLSFSPTAIPLLWTARLALADEEAVAVGYRKPLGLNSVTNQKSWEKAPLVCLCAALKTCLVALDDSELYEDGVSNSETVPCHDPPCPVLTTFAMVALVASSLPSQTDCSPSHYREVRGLCR